MEDHNHVITFFYYYLFCEFFSPCPDELDLKTTYFPFMCSFIETEVIKSLRQLNELRFLDCQNFSWVWFLGSNCLYFTIKFHDFMKQQKHGFSNSTPRVGSDRLQKSSKDCLMHYKLCSLVKLALKSMGQVISTLFISQKNSSNRRTSKGSFWPIRAESTSKEF